MCPASSRMLELPGFLDNLQVKMASWLAQRPGRLYSTRPGDIPGAHFCLRLSRCKGHNWLPHRE